MHRIPGSPARAAVREFLVGENFDARAAAIHSVALWRDRDALRPLIKVFSQDDPLLRRLAAMALGRIGDPEAIEPLLQTYSTEMDPFLSHAIVYALYEIGDGKTTASLLTGDRLPVQGLDTSGKNVAAALGNISSLGHGDRISIDMFDEKRLPYADDIVKLMLVESGMNVSTEEISRVLSPEASFCSAIRHRQSDPN